ncbi:MAG: ABC transporter permease [Acidimicrobiia bacterium]
MLWDQGWEHGLLVVRALAMAVPAAVAIGIVAFRRPRLAAAALGAAGALFTVPSLALFGFFVAPLGLGTKPAVAALAIYALLPVLRNTLTGLGGVPDEVTEAARGMGMTDAQLLRSVWFPLALPVIVAGVRVAAVTTVGIATIAYLVAAGGLGRAVFDGLGAGERPQIVAGTMCIAALALALDGFFALTERVLRRRFRPEAPAS